MLAWLFGTRPSPSPPVAPAAPRPTAGPSLGLRDGDVLGDRYRLDREIGIGGVGRVYQATDLHLEMVVAVKAMRRRIVRDEDTPSLESVVDLRREAAAAMRLSHPFITRVFTWERYRGWDVIIMEYIEGTTLQGRMGAEPDRRLAAEVGAGFALDALSALAYAHARGVCHNDVKPRNFLVTEGDQLKLCDFGIASPVGAESSTSGSGLIGTLAFISPERLRNRPQDHRSDLYSLAATVYHLIHGAPPFGMHGTPAIEGHLEQPPPPSPRIPEGLQRVLFRALEKDPDARFESASQMRQALLELGYRSRWEQALEAQGGPGVDPWTSGADPERPVTRELDVRALTWLGAEAEETTELPIRAASGRLSGETAAGAAGSGGAAGSAGAPGSGGVPTAVGAPGSAVDAAHLAGGSATTPERRVAKTAGVARPMAPRPVPDGMVRVGPRVLTWDGHRLSTAGFLIDAAPVTHAAFGRFVAATGETPPAWWSRSTPPPERLDHPVVGVTLASARRYAAWRGARLPTATEWVLALGDPATWAVPCDPSRCHCPLAGARDTAPVRAHPGSVTADGLHDMLGNVWEWTESADGLGAIAADRAKVFGASFRHACRASRGEVPQSEVSAQSAYPYLGFRCARDEEVP